ncbi:hypothetical protein [Haloarcula marina]|uniref:hypothetical protein n=1 Tax=Haloarcula marina TaxID=2961574 RepID=UPI0020B8EF58|nr:hypothetical protein [Halomicroarcula marina]
MVATGLQSAAGGPVPGHLATGSAFGDTAFGIGIAVLLFALFYRLVLQPARRTRANQERTEQMRAEQARTERKRTTGDAGN